MVITKYKISCFRSIDNIKECPWLFEYKYDPNEIEYGCVYVIQRSFRCMRGKYELKCTRSDKHMSDLNKLPDSIEDAVKDKWRESIDICRKNHIYPIRGMRVDDIYELIEKCTEAEALRILGT